MKKKTIKKLDLKKKQIISLSQLSQLNGGDLSIQEELLSAAVCNITRQFDCVSQYNYCHPTQRCA